MTHSLDSDAIAVLHSLFDCCESTGASDIHLSSDEPVRLRIQGALRRAMPEIGTLSAALVSDIGMHLAATSLPEGVSPVERFQTTGSADGAVTSPSGKRYRFNVFRERGTVAIALRRLNDRFLSLEELGLPAELMECTRCPNGLVIVTGATGSGKSTTLATLIDAINASRDCHIITIEDPVEYIHASRRALVRQRQIGRDAPDFHTALVSSLRQDPDVILVGEIRDLPTIRTAITAAETGHLVFATLHAGDCTGAIERLCAVFPSEEQDAIRRQLALVLRCIFAQRLLPKRTAPGAPLERIACGELLFNTPAIANLIATGRSAQIYSAMEIGTKNGMRTLEQDLVRLVSERLIDDETALAQTRNREILRERLRTSR